MSLSNTWKAPLDLLEQDLWTVQEALFVCKGYFKTNDVYFSIATGERFEHRETAAKEAIENIELSIDHDTIVRFWINTAHDTDERKESSGDGSYMEEKWTKTYLIGWALRHRVELPWLNDAIKEGYVTGVDPIEKAPEDLNEAKA